jgi:hypothetical protein
LLQVDAHQGCRVAKAQFPGGEKVFSPRPHELIAIKELPKSFW